MNGVHLTCLAKLSEQKKNEQKKTIQNNIVDWKNVSMFQQAGVQIDIFDSDVITAMHTFRFNDISGFFG